MSGSAGDAAVTYEGAKRVLFIEGTLTTLPLVEAVLARLPQVRVLPVMQGRRGLELALSHAPALVIVDLELPDLPGVQVLRRLHGDTRTREIPVITFGKAVSAGLADHLVEIGARAHLTHPLDIRRFLGLARDLLA